MGFVPLTAAGILLYIMDFDSTYCTLRVGKSCLVCSSSDLCPGHSYHLHRNWHLADVQSTQALCEGSRLASSQQQQGQSSRAARPRTITRVREITSIHPSYKASLEHNPGFAFTPAAMLQRYPPYSLLQLLLLCSFLIYTAFCYKNVCLA